MKNLHLICVNQSSLRMPRAFLETWVAACEGDLRRHLPRSVQPRLRGELTVVFLDAAPARALNLEFRGKNYATDVLSFESPDSFGELVLCPQVLKAQATEHQLRLQEELGYLVLHGMLHLLGYEHERGGLQERRMYALQDAIFQRLQKRFF